MLFLHELKKTVFSISYILFVIIAVFAIFSQGALDFSGDKIAEPVIGENYGTKNEELPEIIMPAALQSLYAEFVENNYACYPIGFIKNVKLNDDEQMRIAGIIANITGMNADEIYNTQGSSYDISLDGVSGDINLQSGVNGGFIISGNENENEKATQGERIDFSVREDMSYTEFKELMQEVDDILGGGSDYAAESLIGFGTVPRTYEEAAAAYELVTGFDKITGGYARLFSDYAVTIVFSFFPVFLAVIISTKDRYAKISELIYTRKAAGIKIALMRYLAILAAVMLTAVILSYISSATVWGMYTGMELDYFAPLAYDFGWIMPSAMIAAAVGMFLTELTNTPVAIAVQGIWWFIDMNMGMESVSASCSLLRLAPRHNADTRSYFRTQDFIDNFSNLLANRLLFVGVSVILVIGTAIVFEAKRKGKFNGNEKIKRAFANIRNRRNQSQA